MHSADVAAMEEGKGGSEKALTQIDTSNSSAKLSFNYLPVSGNEKQQSESNASWGSFAYLFPWRKHPQPEHAARTDGEKALREPTVRGLKHCVEGYPRFAAFLDSDENYMAYRRFGFLSTRLLLDKQDRLRLLEEEIDEIYQDYHKNSRNRNITRDLPEEDAKERGDLLVTIKEEYCDYAKILCAAREVMSFNRPTNDEWKSIENYVWNNKQIEEMETRFIYQKEDLVTLRPGREHAWLDSSVEKMLRWFHCSLVEWFFCSKESRQKSQGIEVYYARHRIEHFVVAIITLVILLLLVIPIYLLYRVTSRLVDTGRENTVSVGILLVSTLLFSAIISVFTRAKRHEIFAASAAYCAVLVVFIGNLGVRGGASA